MPRSNCATICRVPTAGATGASDMRVGSGALVTGGVVVGVLVVVVATHTTP